MRKSLSIIRWILLIGILVLTTLQGWLHQQIKLFPSIDAFCPFGGLESLWSFLRYQGLVKRIAWSSFVVLFATVGSSFIFRRTFCGNICPLGFLQEIFGTVGRKTIKWRFKVPASVDKILRYLKYPVLILFIAMAWKTVSLAIRPYDPWLAYHHLTSGELFTNYLVGTIILGLSLLGGLFIDRPFCRYLCPMGAFLAAPSKLGASRIVRNDESCTHCGLCDEICPMGISVSEEDKVTSAECISCSKCVQSCPVENTLYYALPGKKRKKISPFWVLGGTILIFTAVIGFTSIKGSFVWKADTGLEGKTERLLWGPQRINDDNTFWEIVQIYQINPSYLAEQFELQGEEDFYLTFAELGVEPQSVEDLVNTLYLEAGLDPTQMLGGGVGCGGDDH